MGRRIWACDSQRLCRALGGRAAHDVGVRDHEPVQLAAKAGVQDCHPYRFRHTFAVNFLRNGGNAFEL